MVKAIKVVEKQQFNKSIYKVSQTEDLTKIVTFVLFNNLIFFFF